MRGKPRPFALYVRLVSVCLSALRSAVFVVLRATGAQNISECLVVCLSASVLQSQGSGGGLRFQIGQADVQVTPV